MSAPQTITKLWIVLLLLIGAACALRMHAQALTTASGGGSYLRIGVGATAMQADYGHRVLVGATAFADSNISPRIGLEYEAHFQRWNSNEQLTETSYLAGMRVAASDRTWRPYGKVLVGLARIQFPYNYATGSYFAIAPGGGLDWEPGGRWAVRVLDVEYQEWTRFTYGSMHPYGVTSGVSFRVSGLELFPHKMRHRH
jgi:hypothetical protein